MRERWQTARRYATRFLLPAPPITFLMMLLFFAFSFSIFVIDVSLFIFIRIVFALLFLIAQQPRAMSAKRYAR